LPITSRLSMPFAVVMVWIAFLWSKKKTAEAICVG
jgi:hypothetical protein